MRVSEFATQFKEKAKAKGITGYDHLDDTDLIQFVAQRKPELMKKIDNDDLELSMRESRKKQISKERQKTFSSLSGTSRFMSGVGAGMSDIYMGLQQMMTGGGNEPRSVMGLDIPGGELPQGKSDYQETKEAYKDASQGDFTSGAGELVGSIVGTAPIPGVAMGKLGLKGALAASAGMGAGMGAGEYVDEGETRGGNAAFGALFGAGGAGAGMLLKKIGAKAFNARKGKMKDAPTQEIFDLAKKYGINLRSSDITGEGKFGDKALERIPLGGMSAQAKKTSKQVQGAIGSERSKLASGWDDEIQESLKRKSSLGREQAKKNYDKVKELSSGNTIKPSASIAKSREIADEISDDVFESGTNPFETINQNLSAKDMTFEQLRKQRSKAGKKMTEAYKAGKDGLGLMYKEMREATEQDIEELVMKKSKELVPQNQTGKQLIVKGEKELITPEYKMSPNKSVEEGQKIKLQNNNDELKKAFHKAQTEYKKNVVPYKDNQLIKDMYTDTPDQIFKKYIQKDAGDKAENFYNLLDDKGKKALKEGFLEKAFKGATDDIDDPDAFYSPKKLSNYFSKMAESKNRIFTPSELKHYNGFAKLMKHAERYGQNNESPSNGMMAIPYILGGSAGALLKTNPIGGSLALGGGLLASNLATFMKTYGKRLTLASSEIGSEKLEKQIQNIIAQLPKISAVSGKELTED